MRRQRYHHHIVARAHPGLGGAPHLRQPGNAVADAHLVYFLFIVYPGNRTFLHRAAIGIAVDQHGLLCHGHVQIRHLHHHILRGIQRFLSPLHLAQGSAHSCVGLGLEAQQIHTGGGRTAGSRVKLEHRLAALQHSLAIDLHPAGGESRGILQHHSAAVKVPALRLAGAG